jgi:hypothetical protein
MGQREYRARSNGNAYDGAANAFQPGAAAKRVFQEFQVQGADPIAGMSGTLCAARFGEPTS